MSASVPGNAIACPACGGDLDQGASSRRDDWCCTRCQQRYPCFGVDQDAVPWLFAQPDAAHTGWSRRYVSAQQQTRAQLVLLGDRGKRDAMSTAAQQRMQQRQRALTQLQDSVADLLQGFNLSASDASDASLAQLPNDDGLPRQQGLLSYRNNVFRDWCWDNGEAQGLFAGIVTALEAGGAQPLGNTLTLGSGAGRLSYDVHQYFQPTHSILLDMNPLLCAIASRVIRGGSVCLPEFPVAPQSAADASVLQHCALPSGAMPVHDSLTIVAADAMAPPCAAASVDTVLTPWLIDILPVPLPHFLPVVNRLLRCGGRWVNSGSLAFEQAQLEHNYGPDELPDLLAQYGFQVSEFSYSEQQYLRSPHSAHGRQERVYTWCAVKVAECEVPDSEDSLPGWLQDPDSPIPIGINDAFASAAHLLNAQVLGAVNGERSLNELAVLLAQRHDLEIAAARRSIEAILLAEHRS